jgi:hypothetical protein
MRADSGGEMISGPIPITIEVFIRASGRFGAKIAPMRNAA